MSLVDKINRRRKRERKKGFVDEKLSRPMSRVEDKHRDAADLAASSTQARAMR